MLENIHVDWPSIMIMLVHLNSKDVINLQMKY